MSIFSRFADIINANINAILDQAEDPEKMIVLISREMEETLVEIRSLTAKHLAEKKQISGRIDWLKMEAENWNSKAEFAVQKGRDDLAKAALREKNLVANTASLLEEDMVQIDDTLAKLHGDTQKLQDKLSEARIRQQALLMRGKTVNSRLRVKQQLHDNDIDGALYRFECYERRLDELEGQVESYDLGQATLASEIDQLADSEKLNDELAALKARMSAEQQTG